MVPCVSWIYCRGLAMSLPFHEQHLAFESQGPKLNVATSIATHFFHAEIPLSLHPTGLLGALAMVFRPRCSFRARKQAFHHPIEVRSVMRRKGVDVALHRPPFFTRIFDHWHDDGHAVLLSTVCLAPPSSWHSLFLLRRGTCGGGLAMHRIVPSLLGFPIQGGLEWTFSLAPSWMEPRIYRKGSTRRLGLGCACCRDKSEGRKGA